MSQFPALVRKLKEIFQIDRPELDFGVYRILNARSNEITQYLEVELKQKVQSSFDNVSQSDVAHLQKELEEAIKQLASLGVSPDTAPKVQELKKQIEQQQSGSLNHESQVFSHLLTFFSRYYDNGDFISQRRYKGDTYAIPYSGEEVVLHWANKDQYYTKSGESFSNYRFKLSDGRSVFFKLVAADTARENRKDNDKDRRFKLIEQQTRTLTDDEGDEFEETLYPISVVNGELVIQFEYAPVSKGTKQDDLNSQAVEAVLNHPEVGGNWTELKNLEPTDKQPTRTFLEKALSRYTSSNTADYFIHKDLGRFLRGELDFYIKNEVMHLDDVQSAQAFANIEQNLRMIQTLRAIALELIGFLASLEDFQKMLWLKKKFVVAAHYCMTLDRVPTNLYADIAANELQVKQWIELGCIEQSDVSKLQVWMKDATPKQAGQQELLESTVKPAMNHFSYLMVDTALFDTRFKAKLLASIDNLDEKIDGVLVHGDNFQGLNLLQTRYKEQVKSIYIDPPYNTAASQILYKNEYKHSSWVSLMNDRIRTGVQFLKDKSIICIAIDDYEYPKLNLLMQSVFNENCLLANVPIRSNPHGRAVAAGFSTNHEFALFFGNSESVKVGRIPRSELRLTRYSERDNIGIFTWMNFRKTGADSRRSDRPKQHYPIFCNPSKESLRVPEMEWNDGTNSWDLLENPIDGEVILRPVDEDGTERAWSLGKTRAANEVDSDLVLRVNLGVCQIYRKYRPNQEGALPNTWWDDAKYSATESGTRILKQMFGERENFSYPKSISLVEDCLRATDAIPNSICLDYFAGSGTTGHAVINLNREDNGKRKYILMEQGEYFDTVLKPRIQKVVYSSDWKDGYAKSNSDGIFKGISHAFKILKIESYEDTLNNLQLARSKGQQDMLNQMQPADKNQYLMHYMLKLESQGSLLSVQDFVKPFNYQLNITVDSAGAYVSRQVDLVETFNYLIGLRVKEIDMLQLAKGYVQVTGTLPTGESAFILWRDCEQIGYEQLNTILEKLKINPRESEYDVIYINGDHNIPSVLQTTMDEGGITRSLKIRQIEREFLDLMFAGA